MATDKKPSPIDKLPVLDIMVLEERFKHNDERIRFFLTLFLEELDGFSKKINDAFINNNMETLRIESHSLKGASANLAATAINNISSKLEKMVKLEDPTDQIKRQINLLDQQIVIFKSTVNTHYGSLI